MRLSRSSREVRPRIVRKNTGAKSQLRSFRPTKHSYWPSNISETLTSDWAARCDVFNSGKRWEPGGFGFVWRPIEQVSLGTDHKQTPAEFRDQSQPIITELTPLCIHVLHWMTGTPLLLDPRYFYYSLSPLKMSYMLQRQHLNINFANKEVWMCN